MKLKHYSLFNSNLKHLDWELLRNQQVESAYYLPETIVEYLAKVDTEKYNELVRIIIDELRKTPIKKVFSLGSGIGALEYQLKKISDFQVVVSDYNNSVLRLKKFNIFDDVFMLNLLKEDIPVSSDYLVVFPRIDTEFSDEQMITIFKKCFDAGVRYIFFIPAQLITFRTFLIELKVVLMSFIKRKQRVFCGYSRSKSAFVKLWGDYYFISKEFQTYTNIYLLELKKSKK